MKNNLESGFVILFAIALVFKFFNIPMADMIAIFTLGSASIFYYGFTLFVILDIPFRNILLKSSYAGISPILILSSIIIGWDYSVLILGVLFKYLIIPGNTNLLVPGLFLISIMTAFGFFFIRKKYAEVFDNFMKRTLIISGIALAFHVLPAEKIIDLKWSQYPEYRRLLKEQYHSPNDTLIQQKVQEEFQKMQQKKE